LATARIVVRTDVWLMATSQTVTIAGRRIHIVDPT
jgi:hypothetical protein